MSFEIDDSRFPVVVTVWRGESSVDDIRRYAAQIAGVTRRALAEGRSVALIDDASAIKSTSPEVKKAIAALPAPPSVVVGSWLISDSVLVRSVMAALRWLNPAMANVHMVKSLEQALREAREALAAAGEPL